LRTILYTKDFNENIEESVNIILSPQFYWIKKIDIPIKKVGDAKKIAVSMFKLDGDYIYGSFKLGNNFFAYAIKKNLDLNIEKRYINSIRLAQTEFYNFDKINISNNHSIQKIDDLLFCFPKKSDGEDIDTILENLKLSNLKINLFYSSEDRGLMIIITTIFLLVNISLGLLIFNGYLGLKELDSKKSSLIEKNRVPATTFQLDSILMDLKQENEKQIKIRKDLQYILKTPLRRGDKFLQLLYRDGKFFVTIKTENSFDKYFSKKFRIKSTKKGGIYKVSLL
jgi:hypothetical protein